MERPFQSARFAVTLAFALAAYGTAYAEERVLPAGTVIQLPRDGERLTLKQPHFLVERGSVDRANAAVEMNKRLAADLVECSKALAACSAPEPGWRVAGRWVLIGIAIGAAFTAGALL